MKPRAARIAAPAAAVAARRAPVPARQSLPARLPDAPRSRETEGSASGGSALEPALRSRLEPLFGADFSAVRVHDDARSHRQARASGARAYTVASHLHFQRGEFQPANSAGFRLLAHELAHTIQQGAAASRAALPGRRAGASEAALEREADVAAERAAGGQMARVEGRAHAGRAQFKVNLNDFDGGNFSDPTLQAYLKKILNDNKIEDHHDSDDKAREIVKHWLKGRDNFVLGPRAKVLLIREMQSGFTGDDDERAILNLLLGSTHADVVTIFSPGGINPEDLDSDFQGGEEDVLRAFYDREFIGGRKAALKGSRSLQAEKLQTLTAPYKSDALRRIVAERRSRIDHTIRDRKPNNRESTAHDMAIADAADIYAQLQVLTPAERDAASVDMVSDRKKREAQAGLLDDQIADADAKKDSARSEQLTREQVLDHAEVTMLEFALEPVYRDVAMAAPKKAADFQKETTPLDKTARAKARRAITPVTKSEAAAAATGGVAAAPDKFTRQRKGEDDYDVKIAARIPNLITEMYDSIAKSRGAKEHADPAQTRSLADLQVVANKSKDEVDLVFGQFYEAKSFKAFQADQRDAAGKLVKRGSLHDEWAEEEDHRRADKGYVKSSAKFWLYYLIQNDDQVTAINYRYSASPQFGDGSVPQNDEAKLIRKVGDPFLATDAARLYEIGRAWDALNSTGQVFVQLFKDADPEKDRAVMWDMFFTLQHEYLHSLSNAKYSAYAEKLGGEHSTEGNTLIEGVDSLLTEIAWTSAVKRASNADVRKAVEPDAVKAGKPFDESLLPAMPNRRYGTYPQALKLVAEVGIRNLYAAYFQGRTDLIGKA